MTTYTVHDRPVRAGQDPDFVLVKEGFNWWALFVPLIWLLARRQWLGLLVYAAATAALGVLMQGLAFDEVTQTLIWLVFALFVAATANDWRRWRLGDRGYRFAGVVQAQSLESAELRWLLQQPAASDEAPARPHRSAPTPARAAGDGLQPFASPFDPV